MKLSIIVPTPDGGSLPKLHESLEGQLTPEDEVLIVGDTFHGNDLQAVADQVRSWGYTWLEHDAGRMAWGHPQINFAMEQATGDWLVFNDDDDVFAPDALAKIRAAARYHEVPRPMLFRFVSGRHGKIWSIPGLIMEGSIGGHCIVPPNDKARLGTWTDRYAGDFDFIVETVKSYEEDPLWVDEVIALAR